MFEVEKNLISAYPACNFKSKPNCRGFLTKCAFLIWYFQDRAISKDPCEAVKQITTGFKKWSDRFMADCGSHQKNPQIPKKMDKFKDKMISHLQTQAGYITYWFRTSESELLMEDFGLNLGYLGIIFLTLNSRTSKPLSSLLVLTRWTRRLM